MPRGVPNVKAEKPAEAPEVEAPEVEAPEVPATPEVETPAPEASEAEKPAEVEARREAFEATRPDGTVVIVDRNIDTGEQTVTEK